MKRHTDAADETADILAPGQRRIEDPPGSETAAYMACPNLTKVGVDSNLDKDRSPMPVAASF
jgi:hypothetical protein